MQHIQLNDLRSALIRQEETIIFALIERAQFKYNPIIYRVKALPIEEFSGSFTDYLLWETEKIHAKVRRYASPDEHPFFDGLPEPILSSLARPETVKENSININSKIHKIYQEFIIPLICDEGDDQNYGSSATCDVTCLQALSKRIHFGKFVAEAKYQQTPKTFNELIRSNDCSGLQNEITKKEVEEKLLRRVEQKAMTYGRDSDTDSDMSGYKIAPSTVKTLYKRWIVPLTKEVEVEYLLGRLKN